MIHICTKFVYKFQSASYLLTRNFYDREINNQQRRTNLRYTEMNSSKYKYI